MPHDYSPDPTKDAGAPKHNPTPDSRRRVGTIVAIVLAIIAIAYLGLNLSHLLTSQNPEMHGNAVPQAREPLDPQ